MVYILCLIHLMFLFYFCNTDASLIFIIKLKNYLLIFYYFYLPIVLERKMLILNIDVELNIFINLFYLFSQH